MARNVTSIHGKRLLVNQSIPARDGTELRADVHLPDGDGPFPTILARTPYGRRRPFLIRTVRELTRCGFAVVAQDFRVQDEHGRGFLEHEEEDGLDTLVWMREQDWADGRVALLGICISSFSSFLMAASEPPPGIEIRAMASLTGAVDVHSGFYRNGALQLHWALPWVVMMDPKWSRTGRAWQDLPWDDLFRHLPLGDAHRLAGGALRLWEEMVVARPAYDHRWEQLDARTRLPRVPVPVLHLTGWYDIVLNQVLEAYRILREREEAGAAGEQRLIVGPGHHRSVFLSTLQRGGATASDESIGAEPQLDMGRILCHWFERWFDVPGREAADALFRGQPRTILHLGGRDAWPWLGNREFPVAEANIQHWYLNSALGSSARPGDGVLAKEPPIRSGHHRFRYDPSDPVPTVGGSLWPFDRFGLTPGPADQSRIAERPDVLVYDGPVLDEDLHVLGPVSVELWAATSAQDTDFTAKLVDVAPDGTARIVQEGIVRGRFAAATDSERLLEPERPYRFTIDLAATAHTFPAGHRVRLEISSSNFPRYDRNLNSGEPLHRDTRGVPADQTVFHGGQRPSRLLLPAVSREAVERLRWNAPAEWILEEGETRDVRRAS